MNIREYILEQSLDEFIFLPVTALVYTAKGINAVKTSYQHKKYSENNIKLLKETKEGSKLINEAGKLYIKVMQLLDVPGKPDYKAIKTLEKNIKAKTKEAFKILEDYGIPRKEWVIRYEDLLHV